MGPYLERLMVEQNGRKFGTRSPRVYIGRLLFMPDCFSLGPFGALLLFETLQFLFYDFRNATPSTIFIRFQPNVIQNIQNQEQKQAVILFGELPKITKSMAL